MDIKARNSSKKGNTAFSASSGSLNAIMIQDSVIDTLGGGTFIHFEFPTFTAARDSGKQS